ncbi:MAG TPA: NAD(P)-dependent oxidoreductase [Xanthobacteraceae bacterium]
MLASRSLRCSRRRYKASPARRRTTPMNGEKARVGIVGVGRMGLAMLKHLVKQGYQVTACDTDDKQLAKARDAGAAAVATTAEVARAADFVIVAVGYDEEVRQVVLEVDGLLANLAPGSIIAVSSTAKPDTVKTLDEQAKGHGVAILDAPICRGRFAADDGTLLALVGGKPDVVERGRAVYRCFCSDYAHLGEVGHGQVGKTMNNLLLWINAVGLIEAGRLAETTGIDLVKLRAALLISSGASDALKEWDGVSFTWALKDMQIVADLADKTGLSLPITGAIKELVKEARRIKTAGAAPKWTGQGSALSGQ